MARLIQFSVLALLLIGTSDALAFGQAAQQTTAPAKAEAIRAHLDEIDDVVDALLEWEHITTWSRGEQSDLPPAQAPANTLISVDRARVQRINALLEAVVTQLPASTTPGDGPRGDLRAHAEKAQQIARELLPPTAATIAPATGTERGLVTIDRTALERLEVELDAMERLSPRLTR